MFACWSKATPELRYVGRHSRTLDDGFSKQELATADLEVECEAPLTSRLVAHGHRARAVLHAVHELQVERLRQPCE